MAESSLKILLLTIGNRDHGSSRLRGLAYLQKLLDTGARVTWIPRIPLRGPGLRKLMFPLIKRWLRLRTWYCLRYRSYDLVIVQKIFLSSQTLHILRRRGIPFVFDFDDAIYINPQDNSAASRTELMVRSATSVITSSPVLVEYCRTLGVEPCLITTPVDTSSITPKDETEIPSNGPVTIGWIGSPWTTKYLKLIQEPLLELSRTIPIRMFLMGADPAYTIEGIDLVHMPWELSKEREFLHRIDIGVMPLSDDTYSRAKGGFKLFQYMAAGIPSLASPVGINREIVRQGETGFLCETELEWYTYIKELAEDSSLRKSIGKKSRSIALEKYSLTEQMSKFIDCIRNIV